MDNNFDEIKNYQGFTQPTEIHKTVNSLIDLLKGSKFDNVLNEAKKEEIINWCNLHRHSNKQFPFSVIIPLIDNALVDNIITDNEVKDILWLCENVVNQKYSNVITPSLQELQDDSHHLLNDNDFTNVKVDDKATVQSQKRYIEKRVTGQIEWYDNKSMKAQKKYIWLKRIQISISILIPFLASLVNTFSLLIYLIGFFGVIISCIEAFLSLGKYHDLWIEYRRICETLRHHLVQYESKSGIYTNHDNRFNNFVINIENTLNSENQKWVEINQKS